MPFLFILRSSDYFGTTMGWAIFGILALLLLYREFRSLQLGLKICLEAGFAGSVEVRKGEAKGSAVRPVSDA